MFGNWGVIGQPAGKGPRGAWKNPNNGYIGDVSPLIGAEITTKDTSGKTVTFHSVLIPPVDRPTSTGMEDSPTGKTWTMEPVSGYFNENQESIAISTNPLTWPNYWPDKLSDDNDPFYMGDAPNAPELKGKKRQNLDQLMKAKGNEFTGSFGRDEFEEYKGERTGNKLMPKPCNMCGYKKHCWKSATLHDRVTSKAKQPPQVWYTKLKKKVL